MVQPFQTGLEHLNTPFPPRLNAVAPDVPQILRAQLSSRGREGILEDLAKTTKETAEAIRISGPSCVPEDFPVV